MSVVSELPAFLESSTTATTIKVSFPPKHNSLVQYTLHFLHSSLLSLCSTLCALYSTGHLEHPPYTSNSRVTAYHVRALEVLRLRQVRARVDIALSHDWPRGVVPCAGERATQQLLRFKACSALRLLLHCIVSCSKQCYAYLYILVAVRAARAR